MNIRSEKSCRIDTALNRASEQTYTIPQDDVRGGEVMLVELTPDECRFLVGFLNECLGELRAALREPDEGNARHEIKKEEIKISRIVRRLESAQDKVPANAAA